VNEKKHQHHHHHNTEEKSDKNLAISVAINVILTFVQLVGGAISGSLALIADAIHNLSDAASLAIALIARKIARKPADKKRTFGYRRAEIIAALVNLTLLVAIGLYLLFEAAFRFFDPQEINGWIVVIIASIAFLVDLVTAILTYKLSKDSINVKAAFLHNLSDAMASLAVIIGGTLIILFKIYYIDTILTLLIAGYVIYQGLKELPLVINILMEGTPENIEIAAIIKEIEKVEKVEEAHHIHVWQLDEKHYSLEAHIALKEMSIIEIDEIKKQVKEMLSEKFSISHSTLEFEHTSLDCIEHNKIEKH